MFNLFIEIVYVYMFARVKAPDILYFCTYLTLDQIR